MNKAEKFIQDCTRGCSNEVAYSGMIEASEFRYHEWITPDQALRAVEIAGEEIYEWLQENVYKYSIIGFYTDAMITDLKQVMIKERKEK